MQNMFGEWCPQSIEMGLMKESCWNQRDENFSPTCETRYLESWNQVSCASGIKMRVIRLTCSIEKDDV